MNYYWFTANYKVLAPVQTRDLHLAESKQTICQVGRQVNVFNSRPFLKYKLGATKWVRFVRTKRFWSGLLGLFRKCINDVQGQGFL